MDFVATTAVIISLLLMGSTVILVTAIERKAERLLGHRLSLVRRWLIPLPAFLLVGSNWLELASFEAWVMENPGKYHFAIVARYGRYSAWGEFISGYCAGLLVLVIFLPFLLVGWPLGWRLVPRVWFGYLGICVPFCMLALTTGVPLRQ